MLKKLGYNTGKKTNSIAFIYVTYNCNTQIYNCRNYTLTNNNLYTTTEKLFDCVKLSNDLR